MAAEPCYQVPHAQHLWTLGLFPVWQPSNLALLGSSPGYCAPSSSDRAKQLLEMGQGHGRSPAAPLEWLLTSQGSSKLASSERLGEVQEPQHCQTPALGGFAENHKSHFPASVGMGWLQPHVTAGETEAGHRLNENLLV